MAQYLHIKTGSWNVKIISMNQSISMLMLKCIFPSWAVADDVFNSTKLMYIYFVLLLCMKRKMGIDGGQCFYRVIFPPRNETVQELYLDKCSFIYRRLSRGRRLENCADSPRICPCPQCGGLAVSCAARRGAASSEAAGSQLEAVRAGRTQYRGRRGHSEHGASPHHPPG